MTDNEIYEMACALSYDGKVPKVVAKGSAEVARRIAEIAKKNGVAIVRDEKNIERLMTLDIGSVIPVDLYEAVSIILAFVYGLYDETKDSKTG